MKKFFIIGMVFAILCTCVGCAVTNESNDSDIELMTWDEAMDYIDEKYEGVWVGSSNYVYYGDCAREKAPAELIDELNDCYAEIVVWDIDRNPIETIPVKWFS